MKFFVFALLVALAGTGCSKGNWIAKVHLVKAENAFSKAYAMRIDKTIPSEERLKLYRASCRDFRKAYEYDPSVFTLFRIESAADACLRVEDFEGSELFRNFADEYAQQHPNEVKYGDAGPWMTLEG